jgi:GTPase-associated protein 1
VSQEILYTSARQGLKPGSRGFCTVVSTQGMAQNLASRLESLSGYRHAYPVHDPRAKQNPVNYSHLLINVGGRPYHVLSRICDAGWDYTKRSNKLAHHVALQPKEIADVPGGPAWVMSDDTFCETTWDDTTRILPAGRKPRSGDFPCQVCQAWAKLAGDAGWAGVLAESALVKRVRPISLIFKPGTDTLLLALEALSLLPSKNRWKVTFSTYFTKLPAGVDCQWRFLLDDSPEAQAVRRDPHAAVIDLCSTLGPAQGGELVEVARKGPSVRTSRAAAPAPSLPTAPVTPTQPAPADFELREEEESSEYRIQPPAMGAARTAASPPSWITPEGRSTTARSAFQRQKRSLLPIAAAGICGLILGAVVVAVAMLLLRTPTGPQQQFAHNDSVSVDRPAPADPVESSPSVDSANPSDIGGAPSPPGTTKPETDTAESPPLKEPGGESTSTDATEAPSPEEATPKDDTPPPKKPFEDILKRNRRLPLPKRVSRLGKSAESVELAKLFVDSAENCELTIIGSHKVLGGKNTFVTRPKNGSEELCSWDVHYKSDSPGKPTPVGTFTLAGQALSFQWDGKASKAAEPGKLQYCLLEIKVGEERQKCILSDPSEAEPLTLHLALKNRNRLAEIPIPSENIPYKEFLRLDLKLEGFPEHTLSNASDLKVGTWKEGEEEEKGDFCTIKISDGEGDDRKENFLEIRLELVYDAPSAKGEYALRPTVFMELLEWRRMDTSGSARTVTKAALPKSEEKLIEITTDSEETIPKAWSDRQLATYKQEVSEQQGFVEASKLKLDKAEAKEASTLKDITVGALTPPYEANKNVLRNLEDRIETANRNRQRWEKMPDLVDTIKNKGRVHFRVYAMIEGEEVDVMRSSGFTE